MVIKNLGGCLIQCHKSPGFANVRLHQRSQVHHKVVRRGRQGHEFKAILSLHETFNPKEVFSSFSHCLLDTKCLAS